MLVTPRGSVLWMLHEPRGTQECGWLGTGQFSQNELEWASSAWNLVDFREVHIPWLTLPGWEQKGPWVRDQKARGFRDLKASCLTFLSFDFPSCKMGTMMGT